MTELDTDRWIRRFHRASTDAPRLICFPHAGGAANYFFRLSAALQPDVQVLAVQYPGRQDRLDDPLVDDLTVLAEQIGGALPDTDGPTAFLGHSMGADRRLRGGPALGAAGPDDRAPVRLRPAGAVQPQAEHPAPARRRGLPRRDRRVRRAGGRAAQPPRAGAAAAPPGPQRLQGDRDLPARRRHAAELPDHRAHRRRRPAGHRGRGARLGRSTPPARSRCGSSPAATSTSPTTSGW